MQIPDSDTGRTRLLEEILRTLGPMAGRLDRIEGAISEARQESTRENTRTRTETQVQIEGVKQEFRAAVDGVRSDIRELFERNADTTAQVRALQLSDTHRGQEPTPTPPKEKPTPALDWAGVGKALGIALAIVLGAIGVVR